MSDFRQISPPYLPVFLQLIARFEPHVYSVAMKDVTSANFGLLIAFVLPGFILLWGIKPYSATIE